MKSTIALLVAALATVPQAAQAGTRHIPGSAASNAEMRYSLSPALADAEIVGARATESFAPVPQVSLDAGRDRFGNGEMPYIEGPSWAYRTSKRGPMVEFATLGGGVENAPYLAHLGMYWHF